MEYEKAKKEDLIFKYSQDLESSGKWVDGVSLIKLIKEIPDLTTIELNIFYPNDYVDFFEKHLTGRVDREGIEKYPLFIVWGDVNGDYLVFVNKIIADQSIIFIKAFASFVIPLVVLKYFHEKHTEDPFDINLYTDHVDKLSVLFMKCQPYIDMLQWFIERGYPEWEPRIGNARKMDLEIRLHDIFKSVRTSNSSDD